MPLRAIIDGQEIIAPLLDDAAWDALRQRVADENLSVVLPCCEVEGYLRRSKYGTRHFAHKQKADCASKGETVEHLRAKADIVLACAAAGYRASPEFAEADWRADVLAVRGSTRIAFEVQWSFLRLRDALRRQRRYERDGVRGCWFFRRPPAPLYRGETLEARRNLPLFHLYVNADGSFAVALNGRLHVLADFTTALLGGRVRFCETARGVERERVRATFVEISCPTCGQPAHIYTIDTTQTARCGLRFAPEADWYSPDYALHPATLAALDRALREQRGRLRMGEIKPRFSAAEGAAYPSFGCPHCDAMLDRTAVAHALYGARQPHGAAGEGFEVVISRPVPATGAAPHWCFPDDGQFCCGP